MIELRTQLIYRTIKGKVKFGLSLFFEKERHFMTQRKNFMDDFMSDAVVSWAYLDYQTYFRPQGLLIKPPCIFVKDGQTLFPPPF